MRQNFAITCERNKNPKPDAGSAYAYLPASLAIGTNVDSYTLSLPADSIYNNNLASDATSKIKGLQSALSGLQNNLGDETNKFNSVSSSLSDLNGRLSKMKVSVTKANIGQFNPGGGMFGGCGTNVQTLVNQFCPSPGRATFIETSSKGGGQCGYAEFVIGCAAY
jgi:hypothetical protein